MMQTAQSASGFVQVANSALEYQCYGPPASAALTLVLLHEGLGCVSLWRDFPEKLAKLTGCRVLTYSRAGYGNSDSVTLPRPTDYMTIEAQAVLPVLLDNAGVERCLLIGHSDGATIAAIYAGTQQDFRVRGLVLIAPHFFVEEISLRAIAQARHAYENDGLKEKLARYHRDVDCAFYGWNNVWLSEAFKSWNVSEVIDYFRIPVLGIQGRDDEYGTLAQLDEIQTRCYSPFEQLLLSDCGHSPHLAKPQQTLVAIDSFYQRLQSMENS